MNGLGRHLRTEDALTGKVRFELVYDYFEVESGHEEPRLVEIRDTYGPDAIAIYGGASMVSEKAYVLGKFARVAVGTKNIDYNGRLCMVSAGAANKKALGVDRASNSWADIPEAEVIYLAGTNVAECAPITTSYIWRARDRGAKLIVQDPRVTPIGRFLGAFAQTPATELGAIVVREVLRRAAIEPGAVDEVILGNVIGAGLGQAPARQAAPSAARRGGTARRSAGSS